MYKKISFIFLILTLFFFISGCKSLEEEIVPEEPDKYKTMQPLTAMEYTNKINRSMIPLFSEGQTFLGHHLDIVKGKYPINQEIVLVENSIEKIQTVIEDISALYEPTEYKEHKSEVILKISMFKDSVMRYNEALKSGKIEDIKSAADLMKNELSTLKSFSMLYQK